MVRGLDIWQMKSHALTNATVQFTVVFILFTIVYFKSIKHIHAGVAEKESFKTGIFFKTIKAVTGVVTSSQQSK